MWYFQQLDVTEDAATIKLSFFIGLRCIVEKYTFVNKFDNKKLENNN